jgi:hypothetical protein
MTGISRELNLTKLYFTLKNTIKFLTLPYQQQVLQQNNCLCLYPNETHCECKTLYLNILYVQLIIIDIYLYTVWS